ncbi:MAG TPA: hypothetical protein VKQ11_01800 [Candidatus Sulfotelmatobacter sp.]|nr:hypothetical protein [Candidatus Sulfotelmatobacter sp.]
MDSNQPASVNVQGSFRGAHQFWEPQRIWYNAILVAVALLWVVFTWPHFRPALNLVALGKMLVLALLANVCYCAAYVGDFLMQGALPASYWRRIRWRLWVTGMLMALVLENYWIADEIYPDVTQNAVVLGGGTSVMGSAGMASNMNFPAPLAVLGFLAACGGLFLALGSALVFWFARKTKFARTALIAIAVGGVVYLGLLVGFSAASHEKDLTRGQEKYFCEIDCHLAYSIADVKAQADASSSNYFVTLRTRFDETTISPNRPKDAALTPSPREVRLLDNDGHEYAPIASVGTPLMTPLRPADSYTTQFEFRVPKGVKGLRLLLNTAPAWPDHLVIGDENSWLHKKTYFAL